MRRTGTHRPFNSRWLRQKARSNAGSPYQAHSASDLAFCLNHLLLKGLWVPVRRKAFLQCYDVLAEAYLAGVTWESRADAERRAATLLPGLLLARVDGKSPVEYLTSDTDKDFVREIAGRFLRSPPATLAEVSAAWSKTTWQRS